MESQFAPLTCQTGLPSRPPRLFGSKGRLHATARLVSALSLVGFYYSFDPFRRNGRPYARTNGDEELWHGGVNPSLEVCAGERCALCAVLPREQRPVPCHDLLFLCSLGFCDFGCPVCCRDSDSASGCCRHPRWPGEKWGSGARPEDVGRGYGWCAHARGAACRVSAHPRQPVRDPGGARAGHRRIGHVRRPDRLAGLDSAL